MQLLNKLNKEEMKRLIKFCSVGVVNTAVDYLSFALLSQLFGVDKYLSQVAAFMIATLNSYLLNRRFTFKSQAKLFGIKLLLFYILNIITMGISVLSLYVLCDIVGMNELIAKIPIMPITFAVNYLGNRLVIFRKEDKTITTDKKDSNEKTV